MTKFLKTKYYPVNIGQKIIIDWPFDKERKVFGEFRKTSVIPIKGERLNRYNCYKEFTILERR